MQVAVGRLSVVHDPGNMMEHRDMDEKLKANNSDQSIWQRLLFMILFAVIFNIAEFIILAIAVVRFSTSWPRAASTANCAP